MSQYLFLFTITPVQGFVAQARKTQDLYAGSFMLSHLCSVAANKARKDWNAEIIFPDIQNSSVPNRFVAIFTAEENKLHEIGNDIQQAVEDEIKRIAYTIITTLKISKPPGFDDQINSYFTINWLFVPYEEANYEDCYRELESLMGAIKTVRSFKQYPDSERGRKCSICGERNVKFYRMTKEEKEESKLKALKLFSKDVYIIGNSDYKTLPPRYLQAGEGLCALCFTKRALDSSDIPGYEALFPSTARIALFEAFKQLKDKQPDLEKIINSNKYEPQAIFALKNNKSLDEFQELSENEKKNTEELYKALEKYNITYSPYYGVMLFDGDSMGEWLSGNKIKKGQLKQFHNALTKRLGEFATSVRETIKEPLGVTVYAGGEDFLGFFNLNYLFEGMKLLRKKFDEMVNKPLKDFYADNAYDMTFSAGIVIAHIKTPLSEVLNWARKMEHEAKEIDNKDAFAISVLKHSGEIKKSVFKWKTSNEFVIDLMLKLILEINTDRLSNTFINKLNKEMDRLLDITGNYEEDLIIKAELKRLLQRSCIKTEEETKDEFQYRKNNIINELRLNDLLINSISTRNFLDLLNIADFISREIRSGAA